MGVRRSSRALVTLLALLLIGAPAAALSPEEAALKARTAIDRAQYDVAEQLIGEALRQAGPRQDEVVQSLRVMRAERLIAQGSRDEARALLADELPPALRRSAPAVRRLLMLAATTAGDEAALKFKQALALALRYQPQTLPEVYTRFAVSASELTQAVAYALEAIRLAKKYGDPVNEVKAMMALQFQYKPDKHPEESMYWAEKALPLARSLQLRKSIGQIEGNLGWLYSDAGDYEYAAELLEDAYRIAVEIGAGNERVTWLIQLGNLRFQKRDWAAADRFYREAVKYGQKRPDVRFALANLASIAIETKRFADARTFNREALKLKQQVRDVEAVLRSMTLDARIAAAEGNVNGAVDQLNSVIVRAKDVSTILEARARLGEVLANANRLDLAFEQFRRTLSMARTRRNDLTSADLELSYYEPMAEFFHTYVDLLVDHGRLNEALAVTELIRADTHRIRFARSEISPQAIAAQQGATIVSYWLGPRRSYVWKITAGDVRVATLESEEKIRTAVEAYRRLITAPRGTLELTSARGQQLLMLLGVPKNLPSGARVIVIPDGSLHALNFETLIVPGPRPHYWIEDVNVAAASSIHQLLRRANPPKHAPRMLLVGNPLQADPTFPPLQHAADELRSVARHFSPSRLRVLDGAAATPAAYARASPQNFDYLHFVAHGVAMRRRPLDSAVILSRDAANNYKLVAREIRKQPLHARLVTISSCHGAGARAYTGEGLVGLAWAFLHAGASNVIAALWEVDDSATALLMDDVYRAIDAGHDPATALREAKLKLLRSAGGYRKPRYWAPFVLYAGT
jgi:CHAT domain-containing protein